MHFQLSVKRTLSFALALIAITILIPFGVAASGGENNPDTAEQLAESTEAATTATEFPIQNTSDENVVKTEDDLVAAVAAGGEVILGSDIVLGQMLTISKDVTIKGPYSIIRSDTYTGTLFTVEADAVLTLDGGMAIDGSNNWAFRSEAYFTDMKTQNKAAPYYTLEAGAPVATKTMIIVHGSVAMNNATIKNHAGTGSAGLFYVNSGAKLTLNNGATITHNTGRGSNLLADMISGGTWTINDGAKITYNHAEGGNGGMSYMKGTMIINGGEISNNTNYGGSGLFMSYGINATITMNGGKVINNASWGGGWGGIFYIHYGDAYGWDNGSSFTMNGGLIEGNSSYACTTFAGNAWSSKLYLNGGTLNEGTSYGGYYNSINKGPSSIGKDMVVNGTRIRYYEPMTIDGTVNAAMDLYGTNMVIDGNGTITGNIKLNATANVTLTSGTWKGEEIIIPEGGKLKITGGSYKVFPIDYVDIGVGIRYNEETGLFDIVDKVAAVNGVEYKTVQEAIDAANSGDTVYITASHKLNQSITVDKDIIIDMEDNTIYAVEGTDPVFQILSNVTFTGKDGAVNKGIVNSNDTLFVLGKDENGSLTRGSLTIQNGHFLSGTAIATVVLGTLTIEDGYFEVQSGEGAADSYALDCVDENYLSGDARIVVKGGTYYGFDPEDNWAEGESTNYCAPNHHSVSNGDNTWTVHRTIAQLTYSQSGETKNLFVTSEGTVNEAVPEQYASLQDMIDAMIADIPNGAITDVTLSLFDDVTESIVLPEADYTFTIDLNSHTLSGNTSNTIETYVKTAILGIPRDEYDRDGNPIAAPGKIINQQSSGCGILISSATNVTITDTAISGSSPVVLGADSVTLTVTGGKLQALLDGSGSCITANRHKDLNVNVSLETAVSGEILSGFTTPEDQVLLFGKDDEAALNDQGYATKTYSKDQVQVISLIRSQEVEDLIAALPNTVQPNDKDTAEDILAAKDALENLTEDEKALVSQAAKEKLEALLDALTAYRIIEGNGSQWIKGSEAELSFIANGPYSKLAGVEVDGKPLGAADYAATSSPTVITLNASYLEALSSDTHTISIIYSDGTADGTFSIQDKEVPPTTEPTVPETTAPETTIPTEKPDATQPPTGDTGITLWIMLMCFSSLTGTTMILLKRKRQ